MYFFYHFKCFELLDVLASFIIYYSIFIYTYISPMWCCRSDLKLFNFFYFVLYGLTYEDICSYDTCGSIKHYRS